MNTGQLLKCVRSDPTLNSQCDGVYPVNRIPTPEGYPVCVIVNLDPHNKPGSHWIAIHIDQEGFGVFFDSYGRRPEKKQIKSYLQQNCRDWTTSGRAVQSPFSSTCGQYCVYFLYHRVRGRTVGDILGDFGEDLEENDTKVTAWLNSKFDVNTEVFELEFIVNQLCSALLNK
jgi:hypothetical protein